MSTEVTLPALGESVTEGTVSRWLKAVGDTVEADEPLLEVSTDKVDTEVPSPASGTLLEIKVPEDEDAEVGAVLAIIGDPSTAESTPAEAPSGNDETPESEPEPEPAAEEKPAPAAGGAAKGVEVTLPALGESVTEGTVSRWLKAVGDTVEADEPLLEVSTDKVDTEVPSPASGTLLEIKVPEDEDAEVGAVLAIIGDPSTAESAPEPTEPKAEPAEKAEPEPVKSKAEKAPAPPRLPRSPLRPRCRLAPTRSPRAPPTRPPTSMSPRWSASWPRRTT
ncbi:2-oxoglutarate dehydrogenase E2, dihydrolipoamide acetyltransferase [Cutibacterium avidum ATCC 25577]|uniref:2-oxoglutarate dehydrogenase E2, dihydrolipoamide acetyltransferase n=1 Tax=Cutibacterium avidum ATCC 25577 TaxID=997355 RepID=G4D0J6_9ACTN|nr:2-oxoglutarate dehydrogenase E2, dihydrolipoamide acetyltransferase [Cutibacterium avidum ATCC 25577]